MPIRLRIPRSRNEWIVLLLGLGVTVASGIPLVRGVLSLGWPKVDASILYSREKSEYRRSVVDIRYRYAVDGRSYTGDRYRFQYPLLRRGREVQATVGRYQVGEPVKIAVNPGNPADSVLAPGPDWESSIPFGLGLLMILFGVGEPLKTAALRPAPAIPEPPRPRYRTAWVLAFIGASLVLLGAWYLYQGIRSTAWPAADGKILYSHARGGRNPETLLWYEYHVDDRRYVASNYRNGGNVTPFHNVAEAAAKRYPAGRPVKVYYDPARPDRALLEPGIWWGNFVAPALGAIVLGAAWIAKRFAEAMASRRSR